MADQALAEFKEPCVKHFLWMPISTMWTAVITLFFGLFPSSIDLLSEFNLSVSCIMEGQYSGEGQKWFVIFSFNNMGGLTLYPRKSSCKNKAVIVYFIYCLFDKSMETYKFGHAEYTECVGNMLEKNQLNVLINM